MPSPRAIFYAQYFASSFTFLMTLSLLTLIAAIGFRAHAMAIISLIRKSLLYYAKSLEYATGCHAIFSRFQATMASFGSSEEIFDIGLISAFLHSLAPATRRHTRTPPTAATRE